jgi:hypothetical protein
MEMKPVMVILKNGKGRCVQMEKCVPLTQIVQMDHFVETVEKLVRILRCVKMWVLPGKRVQRIWTVIMIKGMWIQQGLSALLCYTPHVRADHVQAWVMWMIRVQVEASVRVGFVENLNINFHVIEIVQTIVLGRLMGEIGLRVWQEIRFVEMECLKGLRSVMMETQAITTLVQANVGWMCVEMVMCIQAQKAVTAGLQMERLVMQGMAARVSTVRRNVSTWHALEAIVVMGSLMEMSSVMEMS